MTLGNYTDDELANAAFMNYDVLPPIEKIISGQAKMPIVYMTAVKERIRWLSRRLEKTAQALATIAAMPIPEQDNMVSANMRAIAQGVLLPGDAQDQSVVKDLGPAFSAIEAWRNATQPDSADPPGTQLALCNLVTQELHKLAGNPMKEDMDTTEQALPEPTAYLKFWAYQRITTDVDADEGLEVCRKDAIGADGIAAFPVYDERQVRTAILSALAAQAAEMEGLREDAERLDWMEADKGVCVTHLGKTWYARDDYGLPHHRAPTLREAIDAARPLKAKP